MEINSDIKKIFERRNKDLVASLEEFIKEENLNEVQAVKLIASARDYYQQGLIVSDGAHINSNELINKLAELKNKYLVEYQSNFI